IHPRLQQIRRLVQQASPVDRRGRRMEPERGRGASDRLRAQVVGRLGQVYALAGMLGRLQRDRRPGAGYRLAIDEAVQDIQGRLALKVMKERPAWLTATTGPLFILCFV